MAAQISEDQEMAAIQDEWQLAAEILNAPGIVFEHPKPSIDETIRFY